jgi:hypothetical protein
MLVTVRVERNCFKATGCFNQKPIKPATINNLFATAGVADHITVFNVFAAVSVAALNY